MLKEEMPMCVQMLCCSICFALWELFLLDVAANSLVFYPHSLHDIYSLQLGTACSYNALRALHNCP